jgi:hypothetical protein
MSVLVSARSVIFVPYQELLVLFLDFLELLGFYLELYLGRIKNCLELVKEAL